MNLWEDVYSKHKEGGRSPINPTMQPNHVLSDSTNGIMESGNSRSFEEMYYRNSRKSQTADQRVQAEAQRPKAPTASQRSVQDPELQTKTPKKELKSKYVPRVHTGTLSAPYPATLSKMNFGLSDIWSNILVGSDQDIRTLLVCGAARKEGVTLISFHLAMFLSKEYSMKVLYVDTNLNHAAIPKIQNLPGVYSFVSEKKDLAPMIVQTDYPGLYLLPSGAGKIGKNIGANMLSREPIESLLQFCRTNFDMTIIDGQPVVSSPVMIEFA